MAPWPGWPPRPFVQPIGPRARWIGAILAALVGLALAGGVIYLLSLYGDPSDAWAAALTAALLLAAGLVGGYLTIRDAPRAGTAAALGLAVAAHGALAAALVPRLDPLWTSARVGRAMADLRLLPRQGVAEAPVAVAGYAEPSLVFALGTPTELFGPAEAAQAIAENRPAIVEAREEAPFREHLAARGVTVREVARVDGLNYSKGDEVTLRVYMPAHQVREVRP
ncbi:hypothetical protein [Phenylobacterium sp. J426]|uniref:hypothetical protein n=1 Tax=Phenylobacterium sp. J426 TaxID=2898439 RepID=UPI0027E39B6D|nr:hypothetical protein [Phenylobacterium sp. J426]